MIERLQRIATHLVRFRLLFGGVAILAAGVLILSVVDNPWRIDDSLLIPAMLCLIWAVTLLSFGKMFAHIPQRPVAGASWRVRVSYRLRRGVSWVLALMTIAMCLMVLVLTYQLLRVGTVG